MPGETTLDLQLMPLSVDDADDEVIEAELDIKVTDPATSTLMDVDNFICAVPFDQLEILYTEAANAYKNSGSAKAYITALLIYFGIDTSNPTVVFPVFKSAYMELTSSNPTTKKNTYKCIENAASYTFDGEAFNPVANPDDYRNNYYKYINLFGAAYRKGVDTKAVIFPFQEIFKLEADNLSNIPGLTEGWFFNCIQNSAETGGIDKNSILLSPQIDLGVINFSLKIANRTHLCPPYCNGTADIPYYV